MEEIKKPIYDDAEAKYLTLEEKRKIRKRNRHRFLFIIFFLVVMIGLIYFTSDLSKVKSLNVEGNFYYTKEDILEKANLSYDSRYILIPGFYKEWKLEKDELIENATIEKEMDGRILLQIKEKLIIGYMVADEQNYIVTSDGTTHELDSKHLNSIVNLPLIDGFSDEGLPDLAKAFDNSSGVVNDEVIRMISEIHPYATSYDSSMIKLVMQDGNKIYTSYESLILLNTYKRTLKELKSTHVCMFMDSATNAIVTQSCEEFEKTTEDSTQSE